VLEEGEAADAVYVLVSGRARVIKRTEGDTEVPLNVLVPGDSFGEAELFQGRPRPTTVRAASDVLALRLDRAAFQEIVNADPFVQTYLELQLKHDTLRAFFRDFPAFALVSVPIDEFPRVGPQGMCVVSPEANRDQPRHAQILPQSSHRRPGG